jgi:hypothetical protein
MVDQPPGKPLMRLPPWRACVIVGTTVAVIAAAALGWGGAFDAWRAHRWLAEILTVVMTAGGTTCYLGWRLLLSTLTRAAGRATGLRLLVLGASTGALLPLVLVALLIAFVSVTFTVAEAVLIAVEPATSR